MYVEKPFSHNILEGRQMIAAARGHKRIVQVGTQSRSSTLLPEVFGIHPAWIDWPNAFRACDHLPAASSNRHGIVADTRPEPSGLQPVVRTRPTNPGHGSTLSVSGGLLLRVVFRIRCHARCIRLVHPRSHACFQVFDEFRMLGCDIRCLANVIPGVIELTFVRLEQVNQFPVATTHHHTRAVEGRI